MFAFSFEAIACGLSEEQKTNLVVIVREIGRVVSGKYNKGAQIYGRCSREMGKTGAATTCQPRTADNIFRPTPRRWVTEIAPDWDGNGLVVLAENDQKAA
jgi:hypothetical protein